MNKLFSFFIAFTIGVSIFAQSNSSVLQLNSQSFTFPTVMVGEKDSLQVQLNNSSSRKVRINQLKFYSIYGETPFYTKVDTFTIASNGSNTIWIYFEPIQNIFHNSEMIINYTNNSVASNNNRTEILAVDLSGQARFPLSYYDTTENLSEEELKRALKYRLGQGYNQRSYSQARDFMFMTIDNKKNNGQNANVNTLECVYTGHNLTGYSDRQAAQNANPQFNTEHTFPQSKFSGALPMRSDIHHLFPTTNNSNSQRGNKPFGIVANGTPVTLGGGSFYNNNLFEPRNAQKGKTARAMMYFVIHYTDSQNFFSSQENLLRAWHNSYPVDSIEIRRNNDIFAVQNNRNPFVDYPQLEERITNFVSNSTAPTLWGLDILQTSINFNTLVVGQADTLNYVLVNTGNQEIQFSNFNLSNNSILSFANNTGVNDTIPAGESISIQIIANTTNSGSLSEMLSFNTNIPGSRSSLSIPIQANSIITELENTKFENSLTIYPNPFQDQINIYSDGKQTLQLRLIDALGRVLENKTIEQNRPSYQIETTQLKKGIYFLELDNGKERIMKRMIK